MLIILIYLCNSYTNLTANVNSKNDVDYNDFCLNNYQTDPKILLFLNCFE